MFNLHVIISLFSELVLFPPIVRTILDLYYEQFFIPFKKVVFSILLVGFV